MRWWRGIHRFLQSGIPGLRPDTSPPGERLVSNGALSRFLLVTGSHSIAMILLRISQILADSARCTGSSQTGREHRAMRPCGVLGDHAYLLPCRWRGLGIDPSRRAARRTPYLARHATPGHIFESMWFVIAAALRHGHAEWIGARLQQPSHGHSKQAGIVSSAVYSATWIDKAGSPRGVAGEEPYEAAMVDTWDTKIWWPHAEALYATLLALWHYGRRQISNPCTRSCSNMCFRTFPNPDRAIGEWIQIRDRQGDPTRQSASRYP